MTQASTGVAVTARIRDWLDQPEVRGTIAAGAVAFCVYWLTRYPRTQHQNTYVYLADAFLHGRLHMPDAPSWLDWVPYQGRKYSHQGILPGLLLMPFVAVFGRGFDIRIFGALLGACVGMAAWSVAGRVGLKGVKRAAAWAFPVFGTTLWYEAKNAETWGVAALTSVLFLLLSLREYFGPRRERAIGVFVGLAALARPGAMLALAGYAMLLGPRRWLRLGLAAAAPLLVMVSYNLARWGTITDKSFEIFYLRDGYRSQRPPGIFSLRHLPFNVYSWLFMAPNPQPNFPWLKPTIMGTSIVITSPAAAFALWARQHRWLWLSALAVIVPAGLFYANGFAQFGMRYLLDAVPFLFALVCVALRDGPWGGYPVLLTASILMNAFGVWYTNVHSLAV